MNNLDKAAELILPYIGDCAECNRIGDACLDCVREAKDAAKDVAEAGLLAPDTPQPFFEHGHGPNWEIPINDQGGGVATVRTLIGDVFIERHGHGFITNPEEARKIAAALLAAADYSEEA